MARTKRATPAPAQPGRMTDSQRLDRVIELLELMCKHAQIRTRPAKPWTVADYKKMAVGLGRAVNPPRADEEGDLLQSGGTDPAVFWSRTEPT